MSPKNRQRAGKASLSLLLSCTIHLAILFVISLIQGPTDDPKDTPPIITHIYVVPDEPEKPLPDMPKPVIDNPIIVEPTEPDVVTETPQAETTFDVPLETPNESDELDTLFTELDSSAISTIGLPTMAVMGPGGGTSGPGGDDLKIRRTTNHIKFTDCGIDQTVINSVDAALAWLAEHQEQDGSWNAAKYEGKETVDRGAETAISLLAFLGAGHSESTGTYKSTVRSGIGYLNDLVKQADNNNKDLRWGRTYGSALILMALSEATIFSSNPQTKRNADALAKFLIDEHKGGHAGWNYAKSGDDFSVSGWVALALKSAKMAELPALQTKVGHEVIEEYKEWIHGTMTNPENGMARYRESKDAGTRNMSLVGMTVKSFMGFPSEDPFLKKAAEHGEKWTKELLSDQPRDAYGIYYGTLAAYLHGTKKDFWKMWNAHMKRCLVAAQCQGSSKELGGSWNPTASHTGQHGGRVMDTAIFALCLEVYYRYAGT